MDATGYEVAVVGGSYAGLAAALTLGRSKRRTVVFDTVLPRNRFAEHAHNISGNDGISIEKLRSAALNDIKQFPHVHLAQKQVICVTKSSNGFVLYAADNTRFSVQKLILATGVTDHLAAIDGLAALWGKKILHCTYCHGWEGRDHPALVIVPGPIAWNVAVSINQWNKQLTFLLNGSPITDDDKKAQLLQRGWTIIETPLTRIYENKNRVEVLLSDGVIVDSKIVYTKPDKVQFNNALALQLGCEVSASGSVLTDAGMLTSVPGVYAVGDLCHPGYHQVTEAVSTGHKAAAFCNNQLCVEGFNVGGIRSVL